MNTSIINRIESNTPFRLFNQNEDYPVTDWLTINDVQDYKSFIQDKIGNNGLIEFGKECGTNKFSGKPRYKTINIKYGISNTAMMNNPINNFANLGNINPVQHSVQLPMPIGSEVGYLHSKITDLKEANIELKSENKELKAKTETLKEENQDLKFKLSVKDKEFELERAKDQYKSENSISGIVKTLSNPDTVATLGSIVSAARSGGDNVSTAQASIGSIDNDLKRALVDKIATMSQLECELLWNTLHSENWAQAVKENS